MINTLERRFNFRANSMIGLEGHVVQQMVEIVRRNRKANLIAHDLGDANLRQHVLVDGGGLIQQ